MPTSGSILSNDITLNSQKVVYIHQFKVMAKAVQKIEVIFVWARHCGVALMTRTLYHRYISGRSGGVYTLPPPWRPSPIGPVPAVRGHLRRTQELRSSAKDTHLVSSLYKLYSRVKTAGGLAGVYTYESLAQLFLTSKIRGSFQVYQALLRSCGSQALLGLTTQRSKNGKFLFILPEVKM